MADDILICPAGCRINGRCVPEQTLRQTDIPDAGYEVARIRTDVFMEGKEQKGHYTQLSNCSQLGNCLQEISRYIKDYNFWFDYFTLEVSCEYLKDPTPCHFREISFRCFIYDLTGL